MAFKPTQSNEGAKAAETKPSSSKALDQRAANNARQIQEITDRKNQAKELDTKTTTSGTEPKPQQGEHRNPVPELTTYTDYGTFIPDDDPPL